MKKTNEIKKYILSSGASFCLTSAGQAAVSPNVVIIYADDMGYGDLGANNPESKIPTPNLDKLAQQGMRFTDGHSSSGICTPSRFSILTGQHHWRRFHRIVDSFGPSVFKPDDFTLPKMFKSKGYRTACIGKWHLGWNWDAILKPGIKQKTYESNGRTRTHYSPTDYDWNQPIPGGPCDQGFDYYFGDGTINFPPYCWIENDRVTEAPSIMMNTATFAPIPEGSWEFRPGPMVKGWNPYQVLPTLTEKAVEWIGQQTDEQPFFLYFPLPSPHAPIIPTDEYRGTSQAGPYGDYVYETDVMVGRLLQALEKHGFEKNTLVVFSADNGPEKYAYDRLQKYGHWSSGIFRGVKRDVFEGGHHVPFLIRWPGHVEAGTVSDQTVNQVDLAATLAAIINYKPARTDAIDSYNLLPILKGQKLDRPLRTATVQNTWAVYALRQGDWLFINGKSGYHTKVPDWFHSKRGYEKEQTPGLLYNLKEDPSQHHNLYNKYPEKISEMKKLLKRYENGERCAPYTIFKN